MTRKQGRDTTTPALAQERGSTTTTPSSLALPSPRQSAWGPYAEEPPETLAAAVRAALYPRPRLLEVTVALPLPPSVNDLFATDWRTRRRFRTKKYEAYIAQAQEVLRLKYHLMAGPPWERVAEVGYDALFLFSDWSSDLSNRLKAWEDVWAAQCGFDDKLVVEFHCAKVIDQKRPSGVLLTLYILSFRQTGAA